MIARGPRRGVAAVVAGTAALAIAFLAMGCGGHRTVAGRSLDTVSGRTDSVPSSGVRSLHTLSGHDDSLSNAAFSPDGKLVVTASGDGTGRIWTWGG